MKIIKFGASTLLTLTAITITNCRQKNNTTDKDDDKSSVKKTDTVKKTADTTAAVKPVTYPPIDHAQYDSLMKKLAHGDMLSAPSDFVERIADKSVCSSRPLSCNFNCSVVVEMYVLLLTIS